MSARRKNNLKRPDRNDRHDRIVTFLERFRSFQIPVTHRNNSVELFPDGKQFFRALFRAIDNAQKSLLLEYYIIRDDHVGAELAEALLRASARGVRIRLIYDYIGSLDTPSAYFKRLAASGIELLPFNIPSLRRGVNWFDKRDHRKMTIIDGSLAILGGVNISAKYDGTLDHKLRFRDFGFSIKGDAVAELETIFHQTWQEERGGGEDFESGVERLQHIEKIGEAAVNIISGRPRQSRSYIRETFLLNIAAASEEIQIATAYFVPGPRIVRSLLRAVKRGVRVRLLLPARSDVPLALLLGRSSYATLLQGGVEIYEMDREILHAKVMLIDGVRAVIGSANLDQRSFHRNFEINCIVDNEHFGTQIKALLLEEIDSSRQIQLDEHERRGLPVRLMERVVSLFGWFL